jgi:hypothetical protein
MKLSRPEWLALSAAIANIGLWLQAGLMVEAANLPEWMAAPVEIFGGLVGVIASGALGVAMSFGLYDMVHAAATMPPTIKRQKAGQEVEHANRRFWSLVGASGLVLAAEIYLLGVVVAALVNGITLAEQVGAWLPVWSVGRVLAAALVLAGLSLIAKVAQPAANVGQPAPAKKQPAATAPQPAPTVAQPSRQPLTTAEIVALRNDNRGKSWDELGAAVGRSGEALRKRYEKAAP